MHHTHTHTQTHTPLKKKNLKWLKQCILESTGRNHSQHITSENTRNTFKILLFQVTVTPLHKLNTITLTQQQQFLWLSTAHTQVQVEYKIHPAPIQMCVA
jgi:hypothetical protein